MKPSLFEPLRYEELVARMAQLEPTAQACFGTMSPGATVCHLIDALEIALGITPAEPRPSWLPKPLVRWLVIHVVSWPKGKAKAVPAMLKTQAGEWDGDMARLQSLLKEAAQRGADGPWSPDPAFGRVSGRDYGYLLYKHFDHHMQQFSV